MAASSPHFAKHTVVVTVLLIIPVVTLVAFLWKLHTPTPRTKTPVVITRSSLLPHRFAGPCLNCHRIQDGGPVELNARNMGHFNLGPTERRLIRAGQRVQVPSLLQRLRTPAITRDDILPHDFVGVCSNCHVVLDIRPSGRYMRHAMRRAYQPLTLPGAPLRHVERGGVRERHTREWLRNLFGVIALGTLGLSMVYIGVRVLMQADPARFKGRFQVKKWFRAHEWASVGFCLATVMHWYYSDRGNNFLHTALILTVWLTAAGFMLHYRLAHKNARKRVRAVHTQRGLAVALLILIVVGHFFAEFD